MNRKGVGPILSPDLLQNLKLEGLKLNQNVKHSKNHTINFDISPRSKISNKQTIGFPMDDLAEMKQQIKFLE